MSFSTDTNLKVSTTLHAQLLYLQYITKIFLYGKMPKVGRRPNSAVARLVYRTLIALVDTLDDVLCWARPFDKRPEVNVRNTDSPSFALNPCFDVGRRI